MLFCQNIVEVKLQKKRGRKPISKHFPTVRTTFKYSQKDKSRLVYAATKTGYNNVSDLLRHILESWLTWFEKKEISNK